MHCQLSDGDLGGGGIWLLCRIRSCYFLQYVVKTSHRDCDCRHAKAEEQKANQLISNMSRVKLA